VKTQTSSPRSLFLGALFLLLAGSVLLAIAAFLTWRTYGYIDRSQTASGTITALVPVHSTESDDNSENVTYAPVFTFKTVEGRTVSVTSHSSSNPPGFDPGDSVTVLYDPADPAQAQIDTVWQLWGVPLLLGGMGAFFFFIAAAFTLALRSLARRARQAPSSV